MFTSTLSTHFLHLHHWRQLCEQHPFKMLICFTDQITFWYTPKSQWFSIAPGGVPLSFAPASSEVVNSVGSLHHPGPLHHLEQAGGPGAPPVSTLSATYLNLNSHLLALGILRSLFCLSGRRRDGSPLPQLPTGWLYEHRQAPGDLCLFLTSRRRMFKFNFQKVEFDPASSLYIGQVSLWDQIERGWSFFLQR